MLTTVILIYLLRSSSGLVNRYINGDIWQCNFNPYESGKIDELSSLDKEKIDRLEQVHIWYRHGLRVHDYSLCYYFPDYCSSNEIHLNTTSYQCNVTTIVDTNFNRNSSIKLNKMYVQNEQLMENSNCLWGQSLYYNKFQIEQVAKIITEKYIGNESYNVFNETFLYKNIQNNKLQNYLKLISTEIERIMSSSLILMNGLLNDINSKYNNTNEYIHNVLTHDTFSDPLRPERNQKCLSEPQFNQWIDRYNNDPQDNIAENKVKYMSSDFVLKTIEMFSEEGGVYQDDRTAFDLSYLYCAGLDIPISNETWNRLVNISYKYTSTYSQTDYGLNRDNCYNYNMIIPVLFQIKNDIQNMMITHSDSPKMIIYSAHAWTLQYILGAFEIYDYISIAYAEMVSLEIYSSKLNKTKYYFRFTRKGNALKYKYCSYNDNTTELCDLDLLFQNRLNNSDIVNFNEWQNNICPNMLDQCRCGYCNDKDNNNSNLFDSNIWVGIIIGIAVSIAFSCMIWVLKRMSCLEHQHKHKRLIHKKTKLPNYHANVL